MMARYRAYTSIAQTPTFASQYQPRPCLTASRAGYGPTIFDPDAIAKYHIVDIERDVDILAYSTFSPDREPARLRHPP